MGVDRILNLTRVTGERDGYQGLPRNPPFTRHLATAYSVAYAAGKRRREAQIGAAAGMEGDARDDE